VFANLRAYALVGFHGSSFIAEYELRFFCVRVEREKTVVGNRGCSFVAREEIEQALAAPAGGRRERD